MFLNDCHRTRKTNTSALFYKTMLSATKPLLKSIHIDFPCTKAESTKTYI